jgi:hypothetical protein
MTVRTPDTGLAQTLRQNLTELSRNLSQQGLHGDFSLTGSGASSSNAPRDHRHDREGQPGQSGSQQQSQHREQPSRRGRDREQRSGRFAAWVDTQLETQKERS